MKTTFTLSMALLICHFAMGQNPIPNANFENWSTSSTNRDSLEDGWSSSNVVAILPVKPLVKDTNAFQGDYSAKLITAPFGFVQYSKISILVNGSATFDWNGGTGYSVTLVSGGGTPISFKPTALKGFYKCETFSPASQGYAQVLLTKYNTTLQKRDTVSYATYDFADNANYSPFVISLPDLMPGIVPDSITTIFYSSNPSSVPAHAAWSNLYLDSLTVEQPLSPPVADFSADSTNGTTNTVVTFSDSSTNAPTSWQWTFSPDNTSFQNGTSVTSQNPVVKFTMAGDYSVKLVAANNDGSDSITKTDYIHITEAPDGIKELSMLKGLPLFPNPAKDMLHLKSYCLGASLELTDVQGKVMRQYKRVNQTTFDISKLSAGIYFLKVSKDGQTITQKFTVRK